MGLAPYQRGVGIQQAPGQVRPNLPQAAAAPDLGRVARQIQDAFAPELRLKAEIAGKEAAGQAAIGKDEAGNFVVPPAPGGGGLIYMQAFDQAIGIQYRAEVTNSFEQQANTITAELKDKPEELTARLSQMRDAMLDKIDPRFRTDVAPIMDREITQRQAYATNQAAERTERAVISGLQATINVATAKAIEIGTSGGTDADIEVEKARGREAIATLEKMARIDGAGAEAMREELELRLKPMLDYRTSLENAGTIARALKGAKDGDLTTLQLAAREIPYEGKVMGLTYQELRDRLPSAQVLNSVGSVAGQIVQEREQARREAAAEARAARAAAEQNRWMVELQGMMQRGFSTGVSGKQADLLDGSFVAAMGGNANVFTNLQTREGQAKALQIVQQVGIGYVPRPLQDWLEAQATTENVTAGMALYTNLREATNSRGQRIGEVMMRRLPPRVQAAYTVAGRLRAAGFSDDRIQRYFDAARQNKTPTMTDLRMGYGGNRMAGTDYDSKRNEQLRAELGLPKGALIPRDIIERNDELVRSFVALDARDLPTAVALAARQVKGAVQVSRAFEGGFGPSTLFASVTPAALTTYLRSKGFTGKLGDPDEKGNSIVLAPMTLRPGGLDLYNIYQKDKNGNVTRTLSVDMEVDLKSYIDKQAAARAAAARAAEVAAMARGRSIQDGPAARAMQAAAQAGMIGAP